jgi:hypothetical protein
MRNTIFAGLAALFIGTFLGAAGCDKKSGGNPEACKTGQKDGNACKKCCNEAGQSGYMWNGLSKECQCM